VYEGARLRRRAAGLAYAARGYRRVLRLPGDLGHASRGTKAPSEGHVRLP
jgi:hypothetical protein